ncbi:MAG: hypothetical protein ACYCZX_04245 [Rhodospirillaceae bacterium]
MSWNVNRAAQLSAMHPSVNQIGYWSGLAACASTVAYLAVQLLQTANGLRFPLDEILIYGTSLCIVVPFLVEMLSLHYLTEPDKQFWTHGSLIFATMYAVFVTANYVVQLATVIPAKLTGSAARIHILEQTPHSLFWDYDAAGYICMGLAALFAVPAVGKGGREKRVRRALLAHALVTPLIGVVYFHPTFSANLLLFLGLPWAITAPLFMVLLAVMMRQKTAFKAA